MSPLVVFVLCSLLASGLATNASSSASPLVQQFVRNFLATQNISLANATARNFVIPTAELPTLNTMPDEQITDKPMWNFTDFEQPTTAATTTTTSTKRRPVHRSTSPMSHVAPSTTPLPPTRRTTLRKPKVQYADEPPIEAAQNFFDSMYDFVDVSFGGGGDESDEGSFGATTLRSTTARRQQPEAAEPPTIMYALPQPIPIIYYPSQQQQQQAPELVDQGHRDKRTTQLPFAYGGFQPGYVKGPHQQFITGNLADPAGAYLSNRNKRTTQLPYGYGGYQPAYVNGPDPGNNFLSTQIQVTSAYNPVPTDEAAAAAALRRKKGQDAGSSEEDDDAGDDFGFYDAVNLDGLNVETNDETDDSSDTAEDSGSSSSSSEEENDDVAPNRRHKKINRVDVQHRNKLLNQPSSSVSYEDDADDDDSAGSAEKVNSPTSFFDSIFGHFFDPISWIWPSGSSGTSSWSPFRMFGGGGGGGGGGGSTSPKKASRRSAIVPERRRPKQTEQTILDTGDNNGLGLETGPDVSAWFDPFQASAELAEAQSDWFTTASPATTEEPESNYWNWFGSPEVTTATAVPTTESLDIATNEAGGWNFFGLFGQPSTTEQPASATTPAPAVPTRRPFMSVANPLQNPAAWLGILAQHMTTTSADEKPLASAALLAAAATTSKYVSYAKHQLWRLNVRTEEGLQLLEELCRSEEGAAVQWWRGPTMKGPTDILVPPELQTELSDQLAEEDLTPEVIMWDMAKAILYENPDQTRIERVENARRNGHPLTWHRYHKYADIVRYMEHLHANRSDVVELLHIGRSFEGRPLTVVRVTAPAESQSNAGRRQRVSHRTAPKRAVFIEAGAYGREWIGPAAATWLLQRLVDRMGGNDSVAETLRTVDWYVLPVLNPDGYEYSHKYDRFWKKTRSKHATSETGSFLSMAMNWLRTKPNAEDPASASKCIGTDSNRNWDWQWNRAADEPAFQSDCSEFYAGPAAFSEPESRAVSTFLMENRQQMMMYVSLHSYGQTISYPPQARVKPEAGGSTHGADPMFDMAHVAIESMKVAMQKSTAAGQDRQTYAINRPAGAEDLRAATGRSDAYAMYGGAHIKYAYRIDLRDTGTHGFLLPPSNIEATGREVFELVRGMIDYM